MSLFNPIRLLAVAALLSMTGLSKAADNMAALWRFEADKFLSSQVAVSSDGVIYTASSSTLYAVDTKGLLQWSYEFPHNLKSSAAISIGSEGTVYLSAENRLMAINPDGSFRWSFVPEGKEDDWDFSGPAIGPDGTLFLGNRLGEVYAVAPDGRLKWKLSFTTNSGVRGWSGNGRYVPAVTSDGTVYFASNDNSLYAINPDGSVKWIYHDLYSNGSILTTSPSVGSEGGIYIGYYGGILHAVNPDGTNRWVYLPSIINEFDWVLPSIVSSNDGTVYYSTTYGKLYAIGKDGKQKWVNSGGAPSAVIGEDGTIYTFSYDYLSAIRPEGSFVWGISLGGSEHYAGNLNMGNDGTIYALTYDGLVAVATESKGVMSAAWSKTFGNAQNASSALYVLPLSDSDGDGLSDEEELSFFDTDPFNPDSDLDGVNDAEEIEKGADPNHSSSYPGINGTLKWSYFTGKQITDETPVLTEGGSLFLASNDKYNNESYMTLLAFTNDGEVKWQNQVETFYENIYVATARDGLIYTSAGNHLEVFSPLGELLWSSELQRQNLNYEATSWPTIDTEGDTFIPTYSGLQKFGSDGEFKWHFECQAMYTSAAALADGSIYASCIDNQLYALNNDGSVKWIVDIDQEDTYYSRRTRSYPALDFKGSVYIGSGDGYLYAIDTSGEIKWTFKTGERISSSPVIAADGTIYVGSNDNHLYAINADGSLKWSYSTGDDIRGAPAIGVDGLIYFGSMDTYFYALSPDGQLLWRYKSGNPIQSSPTIADDGTVYVGSMDGKLYAFYSSSAGLMQSAWPKIGQDTSGSGFLSWAELPEGDVDNDGVMNEQDNCALTANPDQYNNDGDLAGDACDEDDDNDGIDDIADAYPFVSIGEFPDNDGDGAPDTCDVICIASGMQADEDDDNDGMIDKEDFFPFDAKRFRAYTAYGDVNGDGRSDILWRSNRKGWNFLWAMEGLVPTISPINVVPEAAWRMATLSDFDGDGKTDIFWRNELTGENVIYLMDGSGIKTKAPMNFATPGVWELKGSGDFNGDGKGDILWRNTETKNTWAFLMDGDKIAGYSPLLRVANPDFRIIATGNVDGDEDDDVIWINTYRAVFVWLLNDAKMESVYRLTVLHENWVVAGFADLDGDGTDDLITRNEENGLVWVYFLNDGQIREGAQLYQVENLNWQLVHTGDYNGDGKADIFWRNEESGENIVHLMDGATISAKGVLRTLDNSWKAAH